MFTEYLLDVAAERYGFDKASCRYITRGREEIKQLCAFDRNHKPYILRFIRRPVSYIDKIEAEMHWLMYLSANGANAPYPLRSGDGALAISARENSETYLISAFSMLGDRHYDKNDPSLWNNSVFYNWGKAVGDMHRLTKDYKPANDFKTRNAFDMRGIIGEKIKDYPTVAEIAGNLLGEIEALPKDRDSYGLIHNDLHPNNILIDGACVNLFDFDGCAYSWYAFDIGNALYLALWLGRRNEAGADLANDIIRYFLKGYLSANHMDDFWLSKIPLFMMLCKISLFSFGADCENPDNADNHGHREERMQNIENNVFFTGSDVDSTVFKNR